MGKGRREPEQEGGGDRHRETEAQMRPGRETESKRGGREEEEQRERESTQEIPNHFNVPTLSKTDLRKIQTKKTYSRMIIQ